MNANRHTRHARDWAAPLFGSIWVALFLVLRERLL